VLNRTRSNFTLKRGKHRNEENMFLASQFSDWFNVIVESDLHDANNFCEGLNDGVTLCRLMKMINGSGMKRYHDPPKNVFQSRENLVFFQESCRHLNLPFVFKVSHVTEKQLDPVISCLLGVAKVASEQEGFIVPESIMEKLAALEAAELQAQLELKAEMEAAPPSYAAEHRILKLGVETDGWAKRSPESWFAGSWMEFGLRVLSLDGQDGEREEWTVYRRYSEFACFADFLVKINESFDVSKLPPKTMSFHLTGSLLEGGSPALLERMSGLRVFLVENVLGPFNSVVEKCQVSGYEPTKQEKQILEITMAFLGVTSHWGDFCKSGVAVASAFEKLGA